MSFVRVLFGLSFSALLALSIAVQNGSETIEVQKKFFILPVNLNLTRVSEKSESSQFGSALHNSSDNSNDQNDTTISVPSSTPSNIISSTENHTYNHQNGTTTIRIPSSTISNMFSSTEKGTSNNQNATTIRFTSSTISNAVITEEDETTISNQGPTFWQRIGNAINRGWAIVEFEITQLNTMQLVAFVAGLLICSLIILFCLCSSCGEWSRWIFVLVIASVAIGIGFIATPITIIIAICLGLTALGVAAGTCTVKPSRIDYKTNGEDSDNSGSIQSVKTITIEDKYD